MLALSQAGVALRKVEAVGMSAVMEYRMRSSFHARKVKFKLKSTRLA